MTATKKAKKLLMKIIVFISLLNLIIPMFMFEVSAAGTTYNLGSGWTVRHDKPNDDGKTYHHLHFYLKGSEKYCLRLDNLKPCDGFPKTIPLPSG